MCTQTNKQTNKHITSECRNATVRNAFISFEPYFSSHVEIQINVSLAKY